MILSQKTVDGITCLVAASSLAMNWLGWGGPTGRCAKTIEGLGKVTFTHYASLWLFRVADRRSDQSPLDGVKCGVIEECMYGLLRKTGFWWGVPRALGSLVLCKTAAKTWVPSDEVKTSLVGLTGAVAREILCATLPQEHVIFKIFDSIIFANAEMSQISGSLTEEERKIWWAKLISSYVFRMVTNDVATSTFVGAVALHALFNIQRIGYHFSQP